MSYEKTDEFNLMEKTSEKEFSYNLSLSKFDKYTLTSVKYSIIELIGDYTYLEVNSNNGETLLPHINSKRCKDIVCFSERPIILDLHNEKFKPDSSEKIAKTLNKYSTKENLDKLLLIDYFLDDAFSNEILGLDNKFDLIYIDHDNLLKAFSFALSHANFESCFILKMNTNDKSVIDNLKEKIDSFTSNWLMMYLPDNYLVIQKNLPLNRTLLLEEMVQFYGYRTLEFNLQQKSKFEEFYNKPICRLLRALKLA